MWRYKFKKLSMWSAIIKKCPSNDSCSCLTNRRVSFSLYSNWPYVHTLSHSKLSTINVRLQAFEANTRKIVNKKYVMCYTRYIMPALSAGYSLYTRFLDNASVIELAQQIDSQRDYLVDNIRRLVSEWLFTQRPLCWLRWQTFLLFVV